MTSDAQPDTQVSKSKKDQEPDHQGEKSWPDLIHSLGKPAIYIAAILYLGFGAFGYIQAPPGSPFNFMGQTWSKRGDVKRTSQIDELKAENAQLKTDLGQASESLTQLQETQQALEENPTKPKMGSFFHEYPEQRASIWIEYFEEDKATGIGLVNWLKQHGWDVASASSSRTKCKNMWKSEDVIYFEQGLERAAAYARLLLSDSVGHLAKPLDGNMELGNSDILICMRKGWGAMYMYFEEA